MFSVSCALFSGLLAAQDLNEPMESVQAELPPLEEQSVEPSGALEALSQVQAYMAAVESLKADFMQEAPNGTLTRGTLYMARPGKVRFDFKDDVPFLVVADGKTLNFVDYEVGQVTRWPVKDTPMLALLGDGLDLAAVNARIDAAPLGRADQLALTASHPDQPEMGQITLFFDRTPDAPVPLRLSQWIVRDGQGGLTSVYLSGEEINPPMAASLWEFEDPRGLAKRRRNRR
jgi:outer membrane lipoprotein-sorting protein